MDKPSYPFKEIQNELLFEFESVSQLRKIRKIVSYQRIDDERNIFNLALLDVDKDGVMSDTSVSNNADMESVLATVIATVPLFFEKFNSGTIYFQGSTKSRTRLYRAILNKYQAQIRLLYEIKALENNQVVDFNENKDFEGFFISKK